VNGQNEELDHTILNWSTPKIGAPPERPFLPSRKVRTFLARLSGVTIARGNPGRSDLWAAHVANGDPHLSVSERIVMPTRRDFLQVAAGASIAAVLRPQSGAAQTALPRLQSTDMSYLGYFTVPQGTGATFSYGGMGLAMGPDGASLYYGGHAFEQALGRISIPAIGGTASIITQPTGVPGSTGGENATELAGALVWNNRLLVTKRNKYSAGAYNGVITAGSTSISGFGPMRGFAGRDGHFFGYMGIIPPEWRSAFGAPCFIGNGVMSIVSACTNGPSFYAFDPDDVNVVSPVPNFECMAFPYPNAIASPNSANNTFSRADYDNAMIFPDGFRTVLWIHRHGYGSPTYKIDDGCGGKDGEGAAPYRRQVDAFDVNDLLAVRNGTKRPYEVRPYAWWVLPGPTDNCSRLSGYRDGGYCFTWDPASRRMFGVVDQGENRRVHVWRLAAGGATTSPPPAAPSNLKVVR
jgi:hypothetical protein